jgi:MFS family permease
VVPQRVRLLVTTGRVLGWTLATLCGGTVLVSISLSDLCSGVQLGKRLADFWSAIGLGILAGQLMGDNIMMYMGSPRYAYMLRACFSALHCVFLLKMMPETLPSSQRRPFTGFENPLRCFRVLRMGSSLRKLVLIALLQVFTEGKHILDMRNLWLTSDVGLGMRGVSNFVLSYSVAQAFGGRIAAMLIGAVGRRTFTTISNICCALSFGMWSLPQVRHEPDTAGSPIVKFSQCRLDCDLAAGANDVGRYRNDAPIYQRRECLWDKKHGNGSCGVARDGQGRVLHVLCALPPKFPCCCLSLLKPSQH